MAEKPVIHHDHDDLDLDLDLELSLSGYCANANWEVDPLANNPNDDGSNHQRQQDHPDQTGPDQKDQYQTDFQPHAQDLVIGGLPLQAQDQVQISGLGLPPQAQDQVQVQIAGLGLPYQQRLCHLHQLLGYVYVTVPNNVISMQQLLFPPPPAETILPQQQPADDHNNAPPPHGIATTPAPGNAGRATGAGRRQQPRRKPESPTITPPYPWATDRRAKLHTLEELEKRNINEITGKVRCESCGLAYEMKYDLKEKFTEVFRYIVKNRDGMHNRAPEFWKKPNWPACHNCPPVAEGRVRPMLAHQKEKINWLFLLLGNMVAACTIMELKYFCEHAGYHRTGARDRLIYTVYMGICNQLFPDGPFDK